MNSFGYGGTNAHVVLAEPGDAATTAEVPSLPAAHVETATDPLLLVSARSPEALRELAGKHAEALADPNVDVAAYCRSAAIHRSHHRLRTSFPAADRSSLIDSLTTYSAQEADAVEPALDAPKLLFVYTGMGPQWWAMGRQLYQTEKVFREAVEECDDVFRELSGWSILDEMLADERLSRIARTDIAQPANVVLQIGLTRLWRSWGVHPDGVLGHSVGELGAAYASNALSLRDTMLVAFQRSRLQALLAGKGAMLAVGLDPDEAEACIERFTPQVSVAAVNSCKLGHPGRGHRGTGNHRRRADRGRKVQPLPQGRGALPQRGDDRDSRRVARRARRAAGGVTRGRRVLDRHRHADGRRSPRRTLLVAKRPWHGAFR